MAIVSEGFALTVTLTDNAGKDFLQTWELVDTVYADALTASQTIIARYEAISDMAVKGYSIREKFIQDAFSIPGLLSAQGEMMAQIVCALDVSPSKMTTLYVKGPTENMFLGGAGTNLFDDVNLGFAALQLYVDCYRTANPLAYTSDGELIEPGVNAVRSGKRVHRRSRKG